MSHASDKKRSEKRDAARLAKAVALIESRGGKVVAKPPAAKPEPGPCAWCYKPFGKHSANGDHCPVPPPFGIGQAFDPVRSYLDLSTCPPKPTTLPEPDAVLLAPSTDTTLAGCDWYYNLGGWYDNRSDVTTNLPVWRARRKAAAKGERDCYTCGPHRASDCNACDADNARKAGWRPIARQDNQASAPTGTPSVFDTFEQVPLAPASPARPVTEHEALMAVLEWIEMEPTGDKQHAIFRRYLAEHGKAVTP